MISHQEAWQVFDPNGEARNRESILPAVSRKTNQVIVGAAHIWIWRRAEGGIEVLLQLRAKDKPTWPDMLDISVAGHVDYGETPLQAAVREADEEIGLQLAAEKLLYIFGYQNFENGIKWVYIYQETEAPEYTFNDGEVQSLEWMNIKTFATMTNSPHDYGLVPHTPEYYSFLINPLHYVDENH